MTVQQIYNNYQIPPNLQTHMLRVASIAKTICSNWKGPINTRLAIKACLIHDMGNILKFDLVNKVNFLGEEAKNVEHWKQVKSEMIQKYGSDEHAATSAICKELKVAPEVMWIVNNWGFGNFEKVKNSDNWEYKICVYSDHRIGPFGVVSLDERFSEQRKRYALQNHSSSDVSAHLSEGHRYENLVKNAFEVEEQIQSTNKLSLNSISDQNISLDSPNFLRVKI